VIYNIAYAILAAIVACAGLLRLCCTSSIANCLHMKDDSSHQRCQGIMGVNHEDTDRGTWCSLLHAHCRSEQHLPSASAHACHAHEREQTLCLRICKLHRRGVLCACSTAVFHPLSCTLTRLPYDTKQQKPPAARALRIHPPGACALAASDAEVYGETLCTGDSVTKLVNALALQ
jgi:hypothetical protein